MPTNGAWPLSGLYPVNDSHRLQTIGIAVNTTNPTIHGDRKSIAHRKVRRSSRLQLVGEAARARAAAVIDQPPSRPPSLASFSWLRSGRRVERLLSDLV